MRTLLVIPRYRKPGAPAFYEMPLGILYVSSFLKYAGHDVTLLNLNQHEPDVLDHMLQDAPYEAVCTGGLFPSIDEIDNIITTTRRYNPAAKVVLGGAIATADPEFILAELQPDYLVLGEGEVTTARLLDAISSGSDVASVTGVAFSDSGVIVRTSPTPRIHDLDSLPFPDWDGFGFAHYLDHFPLNRPYLSSILGKAGSKRIRAGQIITSRGCAMACSFCFRVMGRQYRLRSIENVMREVEYLRETYGIDELILCDDMFAAREDRVLSFCERIKPLDLRWTCQLRVANVSRRMLSAMRESGCWLVSYGFESGSVEVLKSMRKGITVKMIQNAVDMTAQERLEIQGNFIFGDPGETLKTIKATFEFVDDVFKRTVVWLGRIVPYPGTELYESLVTRGMIRDRREFYRHPEQVVNMTTLHGNAFQYLLDKISNTNELRAERLTSRLAAWRPGSRSGEIEGCATCPSCGSVNQYYMDFSDSGIVDVVGGERLLILCRDCRQRFFVRIAKNNLSLKSRLWYKTRALYFKYVEGSILATYVVYRVLGPGLGAGRRLKDVGKRVLNGRQKRERLVVTAKNV
jgi:anaerobic magnesium-protoporphyrin IX monomethyl ester cyclase